LVRVVTERGNYVFVPGNILISLPLEKAAITICKLAHKQMICADVRKINRILFGWLIIILLHTCCGGRGLAQEKIKPI